MESKGPRVAVRGSPWGVQPMYVTLPLYNLLSEVPFSIQGLLRELVGRSDDLWTWGSCCFLWTLNVLEMMAAIINLPPLLTYCTPQK